MELTIVVPAYNEEASIRDTIRSIRRYVPKAKIIVVDDGSFDNTSKIAKKEKVTVILHKTNKGYGVALKTGLSSAKTKYVAFLDADLTYNPKYFPLMIRLMKKFDLDCIWGNRFGGTRNKMPFIRKIGNKLITFIFLLITGKKVYDCSSGQRIIKKSVIKKLDIQSLPNELDFITALSKRIVSRKLKYKVIPINYEKREGSSKLSLLKHGFRMIRNIALEK